MGYKIIRNKNKISFKFSFPSIVRFFLHFPVDVFYSTLLNIFFHRLVVSLLRLWSLLRFPSSGGLLKLLSRGEGNRSSDDGHDQLQRREAAGVGVARVGE